MGNIYEVKGEPELFPFQPCYFHLKADRPEWQLNCEELKHCMEQNKVS